MEAVSLFALCLGLTLGVCSGVALQRHRDRQAWAAYVDTLPDLDDFWEHYDGENAV